MAAAPEFLNRQQFYNHFHVYELHPHEIVYHGSTELSQNLVLFPIGLAFSANLNTITPQVLAAEIQDSAVGPGEVINSFLSRLGTDGLGFFSDINTSLMYSGQFLRTDRKKKCNQKCISVFELNRNVYVMVMNNVYNIVRIIQYIVDTPAFTQLPEFRAIMQSVGAANDVQILNYLFRNFYLLDQDVFVINPATGMLAITQDFVNAIGDRHTNNCTYKGDVLFERFSAREHDLPLVAIFCLFFEENNYYNIKGFGNNRVYRGRQRSFENYRDNLPPADQANALATFNPVIHRYFFHPEVVFCHPLRVLNRVKTDILDWQYNRIPDNTKYIKPYLNQLEKFNIINFKDYAGNIYDTTIWTLLIYESLSARNSDTCNMKSAPVALLSHYLEPYSMCMEEYPRAPGSIINNLQEKYLLDMRQVTWNNAFNVISTNLFNELQNHVQIHNNDNLIYMKIVTYAYLSYKDRITTNISQNFNFALTPFILNEIFSKIFNLICLYGKDNLPIPRLQIYAVSVIYDIFYLVLSAYIAKSSSYNFFEYTSENVINYGEVVDVRRLTSMNISSRIFPFLSNISSVHRGYPFNLANITTLINDIPNRTFDTYLTQPIIANIIQNFNTRLTNNYRYVAKLHTLYADKQLDRPNIVPDDVYFPGLEYGLYVEKVIKNIISICPENIIIEPNIIRTTKRENIIYILKLLKPFFNIIFEEFSTKRYPLAVDRNTYKLPRVNHNGLNHLRSVYFTAYVLETSNFIDQYHIDNNELFLILLSSYFLSIARFNEDDVSTLGTGHIRFTPAEFYQFHRIVLNNASQYYYGYDFNCSHLRYLSNLFIADVFEIIKEKIPGLQIVNDPARFNIDNALYLNALSSDHIYLAGVGAADLNRVRIIDFTSILSLGHYFDHVRPTTGFSQLDNDAPGNPNVRIPALAGHPLSGVRGPIWLYDFITKFYPNLNDWTDRKSFHYSRIYQTLQESGYRNRVLQDPIPMNQENGLRADNRYTRNNIFVPLYERRNWPGNVPPNAVTYKFDAMSIDFNLAWQNIFASFFDQNYTQPAQGTWVTIPGTDNNNLDAP
jgi:hypothetical protein